MKPAPFHYHAPVYVEEAVARLAEVAADGGLVLAGGQSLVPTMAFRLASPDHLVDINRIEGLDRLTVEEDMLCIGANVRHAAFHEPVVRGPLGVLLTQVVRHIAHYPIRQRGTFCGSLAQADPASEWCLVAQTLGAVLTTRSVRGSRDIHAREFTRGAMATALEADELLIETRIPLLRAGSRFGFSEFSRRAGDFALAMALAVYRLEEGVIADPHIGIGGVEDRPRRIEEAEQILAGSKPGPAVFKAAAEAAAKAIDPFSDATTSAEYRRCLVVTMIRRALGQTWE
ncbi:MAG: FAD binding domain-containing protein [Pseudomonadota bacterium]|nr:FAD binding domain-containing protein [Pseudomonadota bacterium]